MLERQLKSRHKAHNKARNPDDFAAGSLGRYEYQKVMRKVLIILFLTFLVSCAQNHIRSENARVNLVESSEADTPKELLEYCKTTPCRKNTHFKVKLKDGSYYEYRGVIDPPIIQENMVTLYPGEEVYIEAEVSGSSLQNMVVVPNIQNPQKTIVIKFWQETSIRDGTEMMLKVINPFSKYLRYELGMMTFESSELKYTSSCPVMPGLSVFEHWPFPIFQLAMADMRFIDVSGDEVVCK